MKSNNLVTHITHNWKAKLGSLLLATALWFLLKQELKNKFPMPSPLDLHLPDKAQLSGL